MSAQRPLYFEDVSVGDAFRSGAHTLDEAQIVAFAREFDPQPFHTDPDAAEHSFFQGLAASGWHTASISMKLLVQSLPLGSGVIGAGGEVTWPRPTRPGDTLHVVSRVVEVAASASKPDRGRVTVECNTFNQRGELCQRLVARLVVMRRPA